MFVKYVFTFLIIIGWGVNLSLAQDDYREFTSCVDSLLEENPGMSPRVAEDICADILDKKDSDFEGAPNYCDFLLKKQ